MEVPHRYGAYDMRWPCVWNNGSRAVHKPMPKVEAGTAHLKLVRGEVVSAADAHEREVDGTRRLIAALAATPKGR